MFIKPEFQKDANGLPDLLLYYSLVEDGILQLNDGALQATWRYDGRDMDSVLKDEAEHLSHQLAGAFNLGSDWMIETNAMRRAVCEYPPRRPDADPVCQLIDEERRLQFLSPGLHFRSEFYLTLTYLPPLLSTQKIASWFSGDKRASNSQREVGRLAQKNLDYFHTTIAEFEATFGSMFHCERLTRQPMPGGSWRDGHDEKVLRFLRECITGEDFPFASPTVPVYLNTLLGADFIGGEQPRVDGKWIRVLAIDRYPSGSWPGMFRQLEHCPFPYRWNTRSLLMDPEVSKGIHDKNRKAWRGQQRGLLSQIFGLPGTINKDAVEMAAEAEDAMTIAGRGLVQFGSYNAKLLLIHEDREALGEQTKFLREILKRSGFGARIETTNAVDAWRGSLPGHGYSDIRVATVHTENFADAMPTSTPYTGRLTNNSPHMPPNTPPLLYGVTDGGTPFHYHQHVGEVPHGVCFGPIRAGKSGFLALAIAQWLLRYNDGQVFCFDKKASVETLCHATHGKYFSFGGPGDQLRLCPLEHLDTPNDKAQALQWLSMICEANGLPIDAQLSNFLDEKLQRFAQSNRRRSLTHFQSLVANRKIQDALQFYTVGSASSGGILDGEFDGLSLQDTRFCVFEMEHLLRMDPKIMAAVLPYLFHRITKRLDSRRPTLIPIDEAWVALRQPVFVTMLHEWLKEIAKLNAGVLLVTQNISDVVDSPLKNLIIDFCQTKIFLPTPSAASHTSRPYFEALDLNAEQIQQIANGQPKRDYFVQSPEGFRRFSLNLGKVALAFLGSNGDADRAKIKDLLNRNPQSWQADWLRHRQLYDWASYFDTLTSEKETLCA